MADELDFSGALDRVLQQQATGAPTVSPATPATPLAPTTNLLTGAAPTPSPFAAALDQVLRGATVPPPAATAPAMTEATPGPALPPSNDAQVVQEAASGVAAANGLLAEGVRPEVVAEIRRISRDQGIPLPLAAQTYIERAQAAPSDRYRQLLQQNPGLRRIATQGAAYADFMTDADELATTEQAFTEAKKEWSVGAVVGSVEQLGNILEDTLVGRAITRGALQTSAALPTLGASLELGVALDIGATEEQILERIAAPYGGWAAMENYPASMRMSVLAAARQQYNLVQGLTEEDRFAALQRAGEYYFSAGQLVAQAEGLVRNPGSQSFITNTLSQAPNTVAGTLDAFASDPVNGGLFLSETILESGTQLGAAFIISQLTGSLALGSMFAAITGGGREYVLSTTEFLAERGYTINSVEDAVAILQNAELMQEAADFGFARALPIAILDGLAGVAAGVRLGRTALRDVTAQTVVQGAAGFTGETLAQLGSEGKITSPRDITIEALAELPTALIEVPLVAGRSFGSERLPPELNQLLAPGALQSAADQAAAAQQALETARAAIEETATFARDPDAVRELLVAAGDQEVSIPVQEIERLYQEGALTDDDIAYLNVEDELTQQGELSGDVVTTASRVLTLQGDAFARLSEHVRTQAGAPTAAEAREALANREADITRLQATLEQAQNVAGEINTLADTIAEQLRSTTSLSRGQARAAGRLMAERYAARAALFEPGTTAQSLYDRDRVTFEGEGQVAQPSLEQAAATTVTPDQDVVGPEGLRLLHGTPRSDLTLDDVEIVREGAKQGKRGRRTGGFYTTAVENADQAEQYARMTGEAGQVLDVVVAPGTRILRIDSDIARLSEDQINEWTGQGYGLVIGRDVRGRTEYVIIDRNAIQSVGPQQTAATGVLEQAAADIGNARQRLAEDPASLGLDADLAGSINPIYRPEALPPGRMKGSNQEAAQFLEDTYADDAITDLTAEITPERLDRIATQMAAETELALESTGNAADWYSAALDRTLSVAAIKYPMLTSDAAAEAAGLGTASNARFLFTYIMATTSQNLDVAANAKATDAAFEQMLARWAAGDYTMDTKRWGTGDKKKAMNENFAKFNRMLPKMPGDTAVERLSAMDRLFRQSNTVGEWTRLMDAAGIPYTPPGQTAVDAVVYGSSTLGPKIGNGFWQNLNGNFSPLTIDLWMRRTWGRLTGKSIGLDDALPGQRERLKAAVDRSRSRRNDVDAYVAELQAQLDAVTTTLDALTINDFGTKKAFNAETRRLRAEASTLREVIADAKGVKAPEAYKASYNTDNAALLAYAKRLLKVWDTEYKRLVSQYGADAIPDDLQPTWARAAKTIRANLGTPLDQVANGTQRRQIETAGRLAIQKLAARGINVTMADMQALLWYPEKELWSSLTRKLDVDEDGVPIPITSNLNESYDAVFTRILGEQGYEVQRGTGDGAGAARDRAVFEQPDVAGERDQGADGEAVRADQRGRGTGGYSSGGLTPLEGAPTVVGAAGPDPELVAVAEQYAAANGIDLRRQAEFVEVDPERATRIAQAYEEMAHAPQDPAVQEAYQNLIEQTVAQYEALVAGGYEFYFFDENSDPYDGNPWNAMRDLRANKRMGVYATEAGFGSGATELNVDDNPMLADTGIMWSYGSPDGPQQRVLANDLFRAVHDAFGHGIEGAGFRARGEENAWQAHVRLFTGSAVAAITTETRGQNSWLNYGPYGEQNRTASVEDTVFADQKTGLMPEFTWMEGRAGDAPIQEQIDGTQEADAAGIRRTSGRQTSFRGREAAVVAVYGEGTGRPVYEVSDPALFRDLIEEAKGTLGEVGAQVFVYDDYAGKRLFLFDDGASGFALSGDDIVSVFSTPGEAPRGAAARVLEVAVAEGGRRLDAFDTFLPSLYAGSGFRAVAAVPFSREFAPEGWDYGFFAEAFPPTNGEPNVVYMVYDPDNAAPFTDNVVADPDAAVAVQDAALSEIEARPAALEQPVEGPQTEAKGAVGAPRGAYRLPTTDDPRNLITLSANADPSTFVHEVGHMFLFQMLRDLADPRLTAEGRAQLQGQIDATRAWFSSNAAQGLTDLKALSKSMSKRAAAAPDDAELQLRASRLTAAVQRAEAGGGAAYMEQVAQSFMDPAAPGRDEAAEVVYHELWARGFEKYLGTGSAPSAELRNVFAKFAQYISNVYKSLRRLNVTVSPEIADVFDRLLATEEAIIEERRGAMYQLSPGVLEGATPAEANELRRLASEAEAQARTEMASRVENSLKAEERAKRRARREVLANEISEQVAAEPVYAATNIAKRGVLPDGTKTGTGKIDRAELVAVAGEEAVGRMPSGMVSGRVRPDNAIPLGDLATLSGFADIYSMIEALTNPTPTPETTAVKERVDAAMLQEFGADLDAQSLQTKAVEVVQNDKFQQLQQLQLRILRRLAAQPMARIAQRQAEQEGAPAAAVDRAATEAAQAEQAAARTPREGVQASLARIRADVQRTANASQRRAQVAARRQTASIRLGMDTAAITEAAKRYVRTIKVKAATPARYRQAAARLTAKIERAIAERNYAEAATLMEQRALNLAVAKEASMIQTKIETQRTRWREVTARSDKRLAQRYSIDWVNAIRVLLEPFGLARNTPRNYDPVRALADLQAVEPTLYTEIQLAISTYAARSQAAAQANPNNPYKDLSVQEALDLLETADTMLANARDSHGILVEGRRVEFGAIADEVSVNVSKRRKVQKQAGRLGRGRGSRTFRETRRQLGAFKASLRRIEQWARDFDNGNPRGPLTRYLVRPVMAAVDAYTVARKGPQEALAALLRTRTDLMARRPIRAQELDGYVFQTKGELIMALLHTGNDSNKRKLLLGGATDVETNRRYVWGSQDADGNLDTSRWDAFVDRLFADGVLTQADMELVQGIWDIFETTKQAAQAAHKQMYGYYFTEVQADPVVTPFGIYPGGYAPAITDSMMNPDGARFEAEEVMSQQSNASMFPGAEKGFTQSRTEYNQPLDLDLTRIPAHFDRVMKFAYLGPAVRQAARLVTNRGFREAVRPGSPDVIDVAVIPWLQRTVQQRVTTPPTNQGWSGLSRVAAAIDRRVGLHIMAANLVNAAQQITGFPVAAARIPARHLAVAATRWRVNNQSARAYIIAQSPFMEDRMTGGMNEASTTLERILSEPGLLNRLQDASTRYGYFAQQIAQNLVDPTVWLAAERHGMEVVYPTAYAEALGRTGDEAAADTAARAEVVAYADSVVRDTQAPLRPSDVSGIEASSPLARLFLKFYSYFNAMGNLLVTEKNIAMNSDMGWAGRYGRSFYAYLMIVTIPTIIAESIAQLARGGFEDLEDEDERDQLMFELLIGSQLKTMAAMVPFAGSVASTAYGIAVTDQVYDDRISLSAGIGVTESTLQNTIRLIVASADPDTDIETRRAIRTTLDALGLALGLPTNWASKPISYAVSVAEGDSRPEGFGDILQGALTGKDGTDR